MQLVPDSAIVKVPFRGARQTVAYVIPAALRAQRLYTVRQLAEYICSGIRSKDYLSEYLAIYNYVSAHTRYMRDPRTIELVRNPARLADMILHGETPSVDCDDLTALLAALCLAVGAEVRVVTVAFHHNFYRGERQYSHVVLQVHEPRAGAWITLDPVAGVRTSAMLNRAVAMRIYPIA